MDVPDGDFKLYGESVPYEDIAMELEGVEGVITHGLVVGRAEVAVIASPDGPELLWAENANVLS